MINSFLRSFSTNEQNFHLLIRFDPEEEEADILLKLPLDILADPILSERIVKRVLNEKIKLICLRYLCP